MGTLRLPGGRDVRATLDSADEETNQDTDDTPTGVPRVVVACPPHPQFGGDRRDGRLRAVSDELTDRGVDCLRIDYGPWDDGRGEQTDIQTALAWARERYDRVGLFGYSFGATMALLAVADADPGPDALSVLAPGADVEGFATLDALDTVACPLQVLYGERDDVVEWEPIVERARDQGADVCGLEGDHFFVGQQAKLASRVGRFLDDEL